MKCNIFLFVLQAKYFFIYINKFKKNEMSFAYFHVKRKKKNSTMYVSLGDTSLIRSCINLWSSQHDTILRKLQKNNSHSILLQF